MSQRVEVAVGILVNQVGQLLVQQRPGGSDCAGQWEFPGGKLEQGESAREALKRELHEELGIVLHSEEILTILEHDYPHAKVRLHTYISKTWQGKPIGLEGQTTMWAEPSAVAQLDLLEAAVPLLTLAVQRM